MQGTFWLYTVWNCTICGKHIQKNLGRHVALYHMELVQLWRCPVTWCTVWKGKAQDWVDHMRRAHDTLPLVKAANLACWFPPWTVTWKQWSSMTRPAASGIAVNTLLFSRRCCCFTGIGSSIVRVRMGFSVVRICSGYVISWRSRTRRQYENVTVDMLGRLRYGCQGHLFKTQVTGLC